MARAKRRSDRRASPRLVLEKGLGWRFQVRPSSSSRNSGGTFQGFRFDPGCHQCHPRRLR